MPELKTGNGNTLRAEVQPREQETQQNEAQTNENANQEQTPAEDERQAVEAKKSLWRRIIKPTKNY